MKTGYVIFAHGSSVESANEAVRAVAAEMARRGGLETVVAAFLEGGQPDLPGALEALANKVSRVVVVPYFLTLGLHLQRDLPRLIDKVKSAHPGADDRSDAAARPASGDGGGAARPGARGILDTHGGQADRFARDRSRRAAFRI